MRSCGIILVLFSTCAKNEVVQASMGQMPFHFWHMLKMFGCTYINVIIKRVCTSML